MRKFYDVGATAYSPLFDADVEILYAQQLDRGNLYMVRYETTRSEDVYLEDYTRIIDTKPVTEVHHEKVFDHHSLGHAELFDSKEVYVKYQDNQIETIMRSLLSETDVWMQELFHVYASESVSKEHTEAMRRVIKEKTGIQLF
ncbi:hypothetical protein ACFVS2_20330 [Brevibacillus sp. NPDC058079]|uniref:hypothetical protein n=1 Tax=Brevibacillus sp. NPDC058079 TaxID=3346330 RepID=UPI0036EA8C65